MIARMFRLQLDYLFLAEGTILKRNTDGRYFILMSNDAWRQAGIDGNVMIRGDIVESTPDVFEDITDIF